MQRVWGWSLLLAASVTAAMLVMDLNFFVANLVKIPEGGWLPLAAGAAMLLVMNTWRKGRRILAGRLSQQRVSFEDLFRQIEQQPPARVPGVEVHLYSNPGGVPPTLQRNLRHNRVLHQEVIVATVQVQRVPAVEEARRVSVEHLRPGFHRVVIRYGFMEDPDVPRALGSCADLPVGPDTEDRVTYILGRETLLTSGRPGLTTWRGGLFAFLSRNAARATNFFHIPPDHVLEIGAQVEI
jgi:KUP system potassium uptake protein